VVMPRLELKAYKRVELGAGETARITLQIPTEAFHYYDRRMCYGVHNGDYTVSLGTSSADICATFEVKVRDGKLIL